MSAPTVAQDAALVALEGGEPAVHRDARRVRPPPAAARRRAARVSASRRSSRAARSTPSREITSTGLTSDEFTERLLREERVAAVPGNAFGPSGEGHVRMCYATSYEQLEEAVRRIARFVERVRAEHA